MAPHAEATFIDTSGYTPSSDAIKELKALLELDHPTLPNMVTNGAQCIDSHDRDEFPRDWILQLSLNHLQEIEDAIAVFENTQLPLNKLHSENFPLPTLGPKIRKLSILLAKKQPYFLIRGLKPQWFSKFKNVVVYFGIASHVGTRHAIADGDHNVLQPDHITDIKIPLGKEGIIYRGPANRDIPIPFHTDYGEILSLYTLSRAASGGDFYLADIHDIEARISQVRPDIMEELRKPWIMVNPTPDRISDERPLLFKSPSGNLAIQASRARLFGTAASPRPCSIPPLSAKQIEAIDALHATGQTVALRFEFRSGDIFFFNNMRMMHARDGFIDGSETENTTKRYLLRLILKDERNSSGWEIPSEMETTWKELYDHRDEDEVVGIHEELFSYKASH